MNDELSEIFDLSIKLQNKPFSLNCDPMHYDFVYGYPPLSHLKSGIQYKQCTNSDTMGLYIHIPFCNNLCDYCYFVKEITSAKIDSYLEVLIQEMKYYASLYSESTIDYLYIGGGTPGILSIDQINTLLNNIKKHFNISGGAEITFEFSPETITEEKVNCLFSHGVNRISIGIQTFDPAILKMMGRENQIKHNESSIRIVLKYYPENINIDLIYGYPKSTVDNTINDINICIDLNIPSITAYQLWSRIKTNLNKSTVWSHNDLLLCKHSIKTELTKYGYNQDMVDWYIKKEKAAFRFQRHKWNNNDFIGLGLSAYGYANNIYYRNSVNFADYYSNVKLTGCGKKNVHIMSVEDVMRRSIVLGIKTNYGADLNDIIKIDTPIKSDIINMIDKLVDINVLNVFGNKIKLTNKGLYFADLISELFYSKEVLNTQFNYTY